MLSTAKLFSRKVFPVDTESVDTKTSFMSMVQILLSYNYLWFQQLINAITLYFNLHLKICYVSCSVVSDSFATPWTVACQAPLIHGILEARITSRQPVPSPGDLPDPGIEPKFPALQAYSLLSEPDGKPQNLLNRTFFSRLFVFFLSQMVICPFIYLNPSVLDGS